MPNLNDAIRIGDLQFANRVFMAPLTRSRATEDHVPTELMVEYYTQRASAGLIITEATNISRQSIGYARTPGIWSQPQVDGWRKVTDAVHQAGGRIFVQLWHVGRISHPSFLNGKAPVAPSAVKPAGHVSLLRPEQPYVTPHALTLDEIRAIVEDYRVASENAKQAGFDGVEIHGANGYLLDQFLQDSTNLRDDQYGGSLENRARLLLEVVDVAIEVWGADRVGLHLSPRADAHDMGDSNLLATFTYVAEQTGKRNLAFLMVREHQGDDAIGAQLKKAFGGTYVVNEGFTAEQAQAALDNGSADAVAFGVNFISNPDLPLRFKTGAALNTPDSSTFQVGGAEGYTDYPSL